MVRGGCLEGFHGSLETEFSSTYALRTCCRVDSRQFVAKQVDCHDKKRRDSFDGGPEKEVGQQRRLEASRCRADVSFDSCSSGRRSFLFV